MSAVDAPPNVPLSDMPAGEFSAHPRARALARRVLVYVCMAALATFALAARRLYAPLVELLFVAPLVCVSVAATCHAVRRACLRIDADGLRWGWRALGVRMRPERMRVVHAYADALAVVPRRGSTWYLAARDWAGFERMADALRRARLPVVPASGRAPVGARLQGYGLALDALLMACALVATLALFGAVAL